MHSSSHIPMRTRRRIVRRDGSCIRPGRPGRQGERMRAIRDAS